MNDDTQKYVNSKAKLANRYHRISITLIILGIVIFIGLIILYGFTSITTSLIPFYSGLITFGICLWQSLRFDSMYIEERKNARTPLAFLIYQYIQKNKK